MSKCLHDEFKAWVDVTRLTDHPENPADAFTADVRIHCVQCGFAFEFIGLPTGSSPDYPTTSWSRTEARMPIKQSPYKNNPSAEDRRNVEQDRGQRVGEGSDA